MPKLSSYIDSFLIRSADLFRPPLDVDPLPVVRPEGARGVIVSFYMANISRAVVAAQRRVLKRFAPPDVAIAQVLTDVDHGVSIDRFARTTPYRAFVVLDIDCIPVREGAIEDLFGRAEKGAVVGAAQRADHIANNDHIYAGPFCVGVTMETYAKLGRPSFISTPRGDVGEELTYAAEERGVPVDLMWPTKCDVPMWRLDDRHRFGHGTTYDDGFWHAFQVRMRSHQRAFVKRCDEFLAGAPRA